VKNVALLACWTWMVFLIVHFLGGRFAGLILQNVWWLGQIAISPKHWFSLRFRRCVFVNNRMILRVCSSQLPVWVFPRRMKLYSVGHRLLFAGLKQNGKRVPADQLLFRATAPP
jgi:hypothetical protein